MLARELFASWAAKKWSGPKFSLTDDARDIILKGREQPVRVHRIKAERDIPARGVKKGDLGGFVELESNLSHSGMAWIANDGVAMFSASVRQNGLVKDNALVSGAEILGVLSGTTQIHSNLTNLGIGADKVIEDEYYVAIALRPDLPAKISKEPSSGPYIWQPA